MKAKASKLNITGLANLIGKPINSPEIVAFFEANGIKYPKKDTIGNKAMDREFWLVAKKLGLDFLFDIEIYNDKYKVGQAHRKDMFYPILTCVLFQEKAQIDYPSSISYKSTHKELIEKFGEPTFVGESRIYTYNVWDLLIDPQNDIKFRINYDMDDDDISQMTLKMIEKEPLIDFHDILIGQTIEDYIKSQNMLLAKCDLFFLNWILQNDYLVHEQSAEESFKKFKTNEINVVDYVAHNYANKNYIALEDLKTVDLKFVSHYYNNLSGHGIYYGTDFNRAFLQNGVKYSEREEYAEIAKVPYSAENLKKIADIIDLRYKEYKEHKFAESKKELE